MKKFIAIMILGITLISLTGCGGKTKENKEINPKTEQSQTETSTSNKESTEEKKPKESSKDTESKSSSENETDKEKVSDDPQAPAKDSTVRTESGSQTDLSKARIALYQASVDSHTISDDKLLELWENASNESEFIKAVQKYLDK